MSTRGRPHELRVATPRRDQKRKLPEAPLLHKQADWTSSNPLVTRVGDHRRNDARIKKGRSPVDLAPSEIEDVRFRILELQRRHEVKEVSVVAAQSRILSDGVSVPEPTVASLQLQVVGCLIRGDDVEFCSQIS